MKIAIVSRKNSNSPFWIEYCQQNSIPYKIVDPYAPDIFEQVSDCSAFMWHINHGDYRDMQFGKALFIALNAKGIKTYPDVNSVWHFDDKIAETYILKGVGADVVPTWIFYTPKDALDWLKTAEFPLVFKLKGGAGASNVWLVKTFKEAKKVVKKAFASGFAHSNLWSPLWDNIKKFIKGKTSFYNVAKFIGLLLLPRRYNVHLHQREKGYVLFQKFIKGCDCDYRVVVNGNNAYAMKRMVRKNDFRASGSGNIIYEKEAIPEFLVKLAFETSAKLKAKAIAYDFVLDENGNANIVEISYSNGKPEGDCHVGYWTGDMQFHKGAFNPFKWMVDSVIEK